MKSLLVFMAIVLTTNQVQAQCSAGNCDWSNLPSFQAHYEVYCSPSRGDILIYQQNVMFTQQQYNQFVSLSPTMIEKAIRLKKGDNRIRFAALVAAGDKKLPLQKLYLESLLDPDAMIRQAARRNLVLFSSIQLNAEKNYVSLAKKNKLKFVDFGPAPVCKREEAVAAQQLWEAWLEEQTVQVAVEEKPLKVEKLR